MPLIQAIMNGNRAAVIQVIIDAQVDNAQGHLPLLQEVNALGESPLICAIKRGYMYIAEILIGLGADPDYIVPGTGETAMMYAARLGHENIVRVLMDNDGNINIQNNNGETASDIANAYGHIDADPQQILAIQVLEQQLQGLNMAAQVDNVHGHIDVDPQQILGVEVLGLGADN